MASSKAGCPLGASQRTCRDLHLRGALPLAPGSKEDRQCPVCGGNISINTADSVEQHMVITCHGTCNTKDKADPDTPRRCAIIRQAFVDLKVAEQCLGGFGKLSSRQLREIGPGGLARCHHDRGLEDDGQRWQICRKIPRQWVPSIREMAMQRIDEMDAADLPSDPWLLIPTGDKPAFYALADRAGIDKRARSGLHAKWMSEDGSRRRSVRSPST